MSKTPSNGGGGFLGFLLGGNAGRAPAGGSGKRPHSDGIFGRPAKGYGGGKRGGPAGRGPSRGDKKGPGRLW